MLRSIDFPLQFIWLDYHKLGIPQNPTLKPPPPGFKTPPDIRPKKYMLHFSNVSDLENEINRELIK